MDNLGTEVHDAICSLLSLLSQNSSGTAASAVATSNNYDGVVSESSDHSSHYAYNQRKEAYEIRRTMRQLHRAIHGVSMMISNSNDGGDEARLMTLHNNENEHDEERQQRSIVSEDNLVVILTNLSDSLEEYNNNNLKDVNSDVWDLYYSIAQEACHILISDSCNVSLETEKIHILLERVGLICCQLGNSNNSQNGGQPLQDSFSKQQKTLFGLIILLVNRNLEGSSMHRDDDDDGNCSASSLYELGPWETMYLLQVILNQCMDDFSWESTSSEQYEIERIANLRLLLRYLLKHLSNLFGKQAPGAWRGRIRQEKFVIWMTSMSSNHLNDSVENNDPTVNAQVEPDINRNDEAVEMFLASCHDFGIELLEYALDALSGASIELDSFCVSPPDHFKDCNIIDTNGEPRMKHGDQSERCLMALKDAVRHTTLTLETVKLLEEGFGILTPLRALLISYASFVASTCHKSIRKLQTHKHQQQNNIREHLDSVETSASGVLIQLTHYVFNQQHANSGRQGSSSLSTGSASLLWDDLELQNVAATTILRSLEVPELSDNMKSIVGQIAKSMKYRQQLRSDQGPAGRRMNNKRQKRESSNNVCNAKTDGRGGNTSSLRSSTPGHLSVTSRMDNLVHLMQAATMSTLILPNNFSSVVSDNEDVSGENYVNAAKKKKQEMVKLLRSCMNETNKKELWDPWQFMLQRKLSEEGF